MKCPAENLFRAFCRIDGLAAYENHPLSRLTSIGTGGRAGIFVIVERVSALRALMPLVDRPWFVLGQGTNLLLSDRDFPGVVISLGRSSRSLRLKGDRMTCGAAVSLHLLVKKAIESSFAGFEELSGIPGSVGGAAAMNAGTHIKEIGDLVHTLGLIDTRGRGHILGSAEIDRNYRSNLAPIPGVITFISFRRCAAGDPLLQAKRARQLAEERKIKHPWREKTFGSTFKNPPGRIAGILIDEAGLKGFRVGGARISPVHANFIENIAEAKALDVLELIKKMRKEVLESFGIALEPEVRLIGFTAAELGELAPYAAIPVNAAFSVPKL